MDWKGNSSKIPLNVYVSLVVVECVTVSLVVVECVLLCP